MKNKKILIFGIIVIILVSSILTIMIYSNYNYNYNNDIDIKQTNNNSWSSYDASINNIKENMDSITESNEDFYWWTLKDFDIENEEYQKILNSLVASVRMCYLNYTDDGTLYTDSNPIRNYRDKEKISKEELKNLNLSMFNEIGDSGCLHRFEQYNTLLISEDEELRNKVQNLTNKIVDIKSTELFTNKNATYNELLLRKTIEVHLIEDISNFLVEEYTRLK